MKTIAKRKTAVRAARPTALSFSDKPAKPSEYLPARPTSQRQIVWVLILDTEYGLNATSHASEQQAKDALYAYVKKWWDTEVNGRCLMDERSSIDDRIELPTDRQKAMDIYFSNEGASDERAEIVWTVLNA